MANTPREGEMEYTSDKEMEGWIKRSREKLTPKTLNSRAVLKRSDTLLAIMALLICAWRERGLNKALMSPIQIILP